MTKTDLERAQQTTLYFSMTPEIARALSSAAQAKGSPLSEAERAVVYAQFTSAPPVAEPTRTFTVPVAELLKANHDYVGHVEQHDAGIIEELAQQPADPKRPLRVRKNLRIAEGFHRLLAAKQRGDITVVCVPATPQEELSA